MYYDGMFLAVKWFDGNPHGFDLLLWRWVPIPWEFLDSVVKVIDD